MIREERDDADDFESELNKSALWAVTYGDVMSYLMIFFLLMFVFTYSSNVKNQFAAAAIEEAFGKEQQQVKEIFSAKGIQRIAKMEINEERIRLSFSAPVLFDLASAELKGETKGHLAQLCEALREIPNPVQIEGHTDNVPVTARSGFKSNWELSSARAFSVLKFLTENGVSAQRLSALGYGEHQPIATNATPEGRAANRRIEINIIRKSTETGVQKK